MDFGDIMTICERIFYLIEKKKLKTSDMCKKIGVSTSTTTNWKQRNTDPPSRFIIPICEFLDVDVNYLLTGKTMSQNGIEINREDIELLDLFHRLPTYEQGKVVGYIERMIDESAEADYAEELPMAK